jgi:hypothetical protein
MNTAYVVRNLAEASDAIQDAIKAAESDDFGPFMVHMTETYRKLNLAWNSMNMTADELLNQSDEDWIARCRFPDDPVLFL